METASTKDRVIALAPSNTVPTTIARFAFDGVKHWLVWGVSRTDTKSARIVAGHLFAMTGMRIWTGYCTRVSTVSVANDVIGDCLSPEIAILHGSCVDNFWADLNLGFS